MTRLYIRICLAFTAIFLLPGCGFKLRTTKSLPPQLHQVYYQPDDPYGQFEMILKRALKASDVILLTKPNDAAPILHITSNYSDNTTTSISSEAARSYTIKYTGTISIDNASGKTLLSPQTVSASRDITLQPNEPFETTPQIGIVKEELLRDLSTKILNILCAKKTHEKLAH